MGNLPRDGSAIAVGPGSGGAMADGTAPACMELDTADSLLDSRDMACADYAGNEADCGMFDDADFEADYLCCACGGGTFPGTGEDGTLGYAIQLGRPEGDDYIVTTTGAAQVDGDSGDDTLEDHNAEVFFLGQAGSDTLISRNGKDALWGGNPIGIQSCTDTAFTGVNGESCTDMEMFPALCGAADDLTPMAESYADVGCCICGGGMAGGISTIAGTNVVSDIGATPTPTFGDQDTYVIYPTTDSSIDLMWIEA